MSKRGRKPPKHEPLICTGCGAGPIVRVGDVRDDDKLVLCGCGAAWNLDLISARLPKWAEQLKE